MNAPVQTLQTLEPRPLYGIGTVARLTGLKSDTLRVWERRYGLGASYKSPTGRRQYTQSDLDHLQLVSALVKQGVRIGEIAASDRKTLEMLLKQQEHLSPARPVPPISLGSSLWAQISPMGRWTPRLYLWCFGVARTDIGRGSASVASR